MSAIIWRALSFTVLGAWPSAQLMFVAAVALFAAVGDHCQSMLFHL
jgi:hypothetical protein